MKNANKLIAFLTGSVFVTAPFAQPESDIATPAGRSEITQGAPDLGQKQKEDWQRLREERKQARQQILSDIKANAKDEIKNVQEEMLQQKMKNNAENENRGVTKEDFTNKNKGPVEKEREEWEKVRNENPPFEVPRPGEHPLPRGPKI